MEALAQLGIDAQGILLYLVNFGILLLVMYRFVYKPLVKIMDDRRRQIKDDVEGAASLREALEVAKMNEEKERKARELALEERIAEAKRVVREDAKKLLQDAESQRDGIIAKANETAQTTIAGAMAGAEREIIDRVRKVVTHVLKEVPQDIVEASVQDSWKRVTQKN